MNKEDFGMVKRAKSFTHAIRGIGMIIKTQPNFWIEILYGIVIVILGIHYHIHKVDWLMLIISTAIVMISEAFNTAFEIDINLTSPEYHPFAKDTKDMAAGAVLISVVLALVVALVVFMPKVLMYN